MEKKASMTSLHATPSHQNHPTSYPVRLMKLSSAQPLLHTSAKPGQKMLHRLALIIQESAATPQESTKGKLPVEAAYVVMKKVTESAGAPIMPVGMSTFNKLESLRTDPAVTVLKQQTWKEFFSSQRPNSPSNTMRASNQLRSTQSLQKTIPDTPESANDNKPQDGPTLLDVIVDTMIGRLETLWDELKISEKERKFYRKTLCKFPAQSLDQAKDLSLYIDALQQHKVATKAVLFAIHSREKAVKRCYDVLLALNRKYARILSAQRDSSMGSSLRPSSAPPTPMIGKSSKLDSAPTSQAIQAFWKEELVMALDDVRCGSLDVIKAVQLWRRNMWRPHAFIFKEQNYLLKMQNDMSVLESDIYQRLLSFVPLELNQLVCVVFGKGVVEELSSRGLNIPSNDRQVEGEDPSEDVVRKMMFEFITNIDAGELEVAAKVVLQEETLQKALATEQMSLINKGVFIPLLRTKFISDSEDLEEM